MATLPSRRTVASLLISCSLVFSAACGGREGRDGSTPAESPTPPTLEYMLASIDQGYAVREDTVEVKRFRYLLKALVARTGETQDDVANATVQTSNHAKEQYGKVLKNLYLMEQAKEFYEATGSKEDYRFVLAAIVIRDAK